MKITTRKRANLVDFFQKITAAHHPEAAYFIVAFDHKKGAEFSENLQIFFTMHKFLKILHWEVKITARKPANLVDFFQKITAAHHPACGVFNSIFGNARKL